MNKGEKTADESVPGIDGTEEPDDQVRSKQLSGGQNPGRPTPSPRVVLYTSSHTLFRQSSGEETDILEAAGRRPGLGTEGGLFILGSPVSEGPHSHFCPDPSLNSPRALLTSAQPESMGLGAIPWNAASS